VFLVPNRYNWRDYRLYTCLSYSLSVSSSTKFSRLFSAMCAAIVLKLCTWLYIYDLQIKFEDGCYRPIFGRVMSLELIYIYDQQIKFQDGCYWPTFGRVMHLELTRFKGFYSFPAPGPAVLACFYALVFCVFLMTRPFYRYQNFLTSWP
jgi:hypothetical protein